MHLGYSCESTNLSYVSEWRLLNSEILSGDMQLQKFTISLNDKNTLMRIVSIILNNH